MAKYNFETELTKNSNHMNMIRRKYKNHKFSKKELFGV